MGVHQRSPPPAALRSARFGDTDGHMAQIAVQNAVGHQLPDMGDALVARPLELLERQAGRAVGGVKLLGALARVPLRLEAGSTRAIFSKLTR